MFFRIVPILLMVTAVALGLPTGGVNNDRSLEHTARVSYLHNHASIQGYGQEGPVYANYAHKDYPYALNNGQSAHSLEQRRRELPHKYLYARVLGEIKFGGQFAGATQEHKDHIEALVRAHHASLDNTHRHHSATQAVVFKDFHRSPGEDESVPEHVTVRYFNGSIRKKNALKPAGHVSRP